MSFLCVVSFTNLAGRLMIWMSSKVELREVVGRRAVLQDAAEGGRRDDAEADSFAAGVWF